MDKLRTIPLAFVCGLLATPAFAQLTTIGPDTAGVEEFILTLKEGPIVEGTSFREWLPVLTPHPLGSPTGALVSGFDFLASGAGPGFPTVSCLSGCIAPQSAGSGGFRQLVVMFAKPVSFVEVTQITENQVGAWAYNAQGQLLAGSSRFPFQPEPPTTISIPLESSGGIVDVVAGGFGDTSGGVTAVKFLPSSNVPEPSTFSLLALALAGLAITRKRLVS